MTESDPFGGKLLEFRLRYLGSIPFGPLVASLVKELITDKGLSVLEIGNLASHFLRSLARYKEYRIFSPWYRNLVNNLTMMQAIDCMYAEKLNPWTAEVAEIVKPFQVSKDYEFAIVPPIKFKKGQHPFLLGKHEVTNEQFLSFIHSTPPVNEDSTVNGNEWAVERMTVAAGCSQKKLSTNHILSNEYHLFHWLPSRSTPFLEEERSENSDILFRPPIRDLGKPVTYISWYAAAAYCDWISIATGLTRFYKSILKAASGKKTYKRYLRDSICNGFRLPTKEEWVWAAKGGHEDIERAWELYPYYLSHNDRQIVINGGSEIKDENARQCYLDAQKAMRKILLDPYKQSGNVVHDESNEFGVAGQIGNVREWCDSSSHEYINESKPELTQRLILGATGYLGESTFNLKYEASLYPRNTNPDVGFRIARTLRQEEIEILRERESAIASLPNGAKE